MTPTQVYISGPLSKVAVEKLAGYIFKLNFSLLFLHCKLLFPHPSPSRGGESPQTTLKKFQMHLDFKHCVDSRHYTERFSASCSTFLLQTLFSNKLGVGKYFFKIFPLLNFEKMIWCHFTRDKYLCFEV